MDLSSIGRSLVVGTSDVVTSLPFVEGSVVIALICVCRRPFRLSRSCYTRRNRLSGARCLEKVLEGRVCLPDEWGFILSGPFGFPVPSVSTDTPLCKYIREYNCLVYCP